MFTDKMYTQSTPGRVFALTQIVNANSEGISDKEAKRKMLLEGDTDIFPKVKNTAVELGLISDNDNFLASTEAGIKITTPEHFREYVICSLPNFINGKFWNTTKTVFDLNGRYLKKAARNLTDLKTDYPEDLAEVEVEEIRAWRFWASYLGLGSTLGRNQMIFLPNSANYIETLLGVKGKNIIGKEISVSEFLDTLEKPIQLIVTENNRSKKEFNLGTASGISTLVQAGILKAEHQLDAKDTWSGSFYHTGNTVISRIEYLGGDRHE